jgi:hypothetical protein
MTVAEDPRFSRATAVPCIRPAVVPKLQRAIVVAALLCACGGDDGREPGTELGPCLQEQFCESPLRCVDGVCVSPDQVGGGDETGAEPGTSGASRDAADDGTPGDDGPADDGAMSTSGDVPSDDGTPGDDGGATVYCTDSTDGGCLCGHTADYGPPANACSEATVGGSAQCCASEGWPAYGGCSCWTRSCRVLTFGTCYCGIGSPDGEDEPVSSCSTTSGICCLDDDGGTCACWDDITVCLEGSSEVSSCSIESLHCGDASSVTACN